MSWPMSSNGHLRGPVTLTAFDSGAVTISALTTYVVICPDRGSNLDLPHARRMAALQLRHRGGLLFLK